MSERSLAARTADDYISVLQAIAREKPSTPTFRRARRPTAGSVLACLRR